MKHSYYCIGVSFIPASTCLDSRETQTLEAYRNYEALSSQILKGSAKPLQSLFSKWEWQPQWSN